MEIGAPVRTIVVEPLEEPVPRAPAEPAPEPEPAPQAPVEEPAR